MQHCTGSTYMNSLLIIVHIFIIISRWPGKYCLSFRDMKKDVDRFSNLPDMHKKNHKNRFGNIHQDTRILYRFCIVLTKINCRFIRRIEKCICELCVATLKLNFEMLPVSSVFAFVELLCLRVLSEIRKTLKRPANILGKYAVTFDFSKVELVVIYLYGRQFLIRVNRGLVFLHGIGSQTNRKVTY